MSDVPVEVPQDAKVITVTLNPSLDRTLTTHFLSLGYHNTTTGTTRLDPAGRGVNVSRALHRLGVPTHAVMLLGNDATGRAYEALLGEEDFPMTILRRSGRTRSNIVIVDAGHNNETVILEEGEGVTRADRQATSNMLLKLIRPGDSVVFAGSLPAGVRTDVYAQLTSLSQTVGGAVAINAGGGEALAQSIQAKPALIYVTQTQLEGLFNVPVRADEDVIYCARMLRRQGVKRVLVAMEQRESAFLVTEDGVWRADWPEATGSRSGRAEALIAGYLAGRLKNRPFGHALKLGAVMAVYTGTQLGHEFGTFENMEEHVGQVLVTPFDIIDDLVGAQMESF